MSQREQMQQRTSLFDQLVGKREQIIGYAQPKRLCGLRVNKQLELGRPQHRQVVGPCTPENAAIVAADLAVRFRRVCSITDQTAVNRVIALPVNGLARRLAYLLRRRIGSWIVRIHQIVESRRRRTSLLKRSFALGAPSLAWPRHRHHGCALFCLSQIATALEPPNSGKDD
jgi:hypothetical protein